MRTYFQKLSLTSRQYANQIAEFILTTQGIFMKKLLALSTLVVALAACSERPAPPQHGQDQAPQHAQGQMPHHNSEIDAALKSCHETIGKTQDMSKLDACMKAKGFEKPANHPKGKKPSKSTN